jgi:hypothetical protein
MITEGTLRFPEPASVDSLVVDLAIGSVSGPEEEVFGNVQDIDVDADGVIYVLDGSLRTVRVFSPSGEYLRSLGRQGEGPAEFRSPTQISVAPDGSVWVYDDLARVVVAIAPDGREVTRHPTRASGPTGGPLSFTWDGRIGDDGRLVQTIQHTDLMPANTMGVFDLELRLFIRYLDPATGIVDSVSVGADRLRRFRRQAPGPGGMMGTLQGVVSFDGRRLVALDRDGSVWTALSTAYELRRTSLMGDTLIVRLDVPDRPAGPEELGAWEPFEAEGVARPERGHLLWRMFTDDENRLWVQRAAGYETTGRFDVFGPTGEILGSVHVAGSPDRYATTVRGGYLYSVDYDELGVARVIRAPVPDFH